MQHRRIIVPADPITPVAVHGILRAVLRRAQVHDHVKRNVALLVDPPRGTAGRPSKTLTADQAARLLAAAEADEALRDMNCAGSWY
jgi:hypothetical protein